MAQMLIRVNDVMDEALKRIERIKGDRDEMDLFDDELDEIDACKDTVASEVLKQWSER